MTDQHARIAQLEAALRDADAALIEASVTIADAPVAIRRNRKIIIDNARWAIRAALSSAPAPDTTAGAVQEAARVLLRADLQRYHWTDEEEAGSDLDYVGMTLRDDGDWISVADLRALAGETE